MSPWMEKKKMQRGANQYYTTFFMDPDFQFVRASVKFHTLFWHKHKMAHHPDLTPESEMGSIFSRYDRYQSCGAMQHQRSIIFIQMLYLSGSFLVRYSIWMLWRDTVAKSRSFLPCGNDGPLLTSCLPVVRQSRRASQPLGLGLLAPEHTSALRQHTSLTPPLL